MLHYFNQKKSQHIILIVKCSTSLWTHHLESEKQCIIVMEA